MGEAWISEVVWLAVWWSWAALEMIGWIERALVRMKISAAGSAAFWTRWAARTSPGTERPDLRRSGLFRRSFGWVFWFGGFWWLGIRWEGTGGFWLRLWGGELLVSTWDDFRDWGLASWIFLPPFPIVSHSAPDSLVVTVEDKEVVGVLIPADVGETTGASFSLFVKTGRRVPGFWSSFFEAFFPGQGFVQRRLLEAYALPHLTSWERSRRS